MRTRPSSLLWKQAQLELNEGKLLIYPSLITSSNFSLIICSESKDLLSLPTLPPKEKDLDLDIIDQVFDSPFHSEIFSNLCTFLLLIPSRLCFLFLFKRKRNEINDVEEGGDRIVFAKMIDSYCNPSKKILKKTFFLLLLMLLLIG